MVIDNSFTSEQVAIILSMMLKKNPEIVLTEPGSAQNDLGEIIKCSIENVLELLFDCDDGTEITLWEEDYLFQKENGQWLVL